MMKLITSLAASYLEQVSSLKSANAKLENQIQEWSREKTPPQRNQSKNQSIIEDLQNQIGAAVQDNASLCLQIHNSRLAASDFKQLSETELAGRMVVEGDIAELCRVLDDLTLARSDLKTQAEDLEEELVFMNKNHKEEMAAVRSLEVDAVCPEDAYRTVDKLRAQYEDINETCLQNTEARYWVKFDELNRRTSSSLETLQMSQCQINDLRDMLQVQEIKLQSQLSLTAATKTKLDEKTFYYNLKLQRFQNRVDSLEDETSRARGDVQCWAAMNQDLLDLTTRQKLEILDYWRVLEGGT